MLPRVVKVRHLHGFTLELTFSTGEVAEVDFSDWAPTFGGILEPLRSPAFFALAMLEPEFGTVQWPGASPDGRIDFCPDVLYSKVTGRPLPAEETSILAVS